MRGTLLVGGLILSLPFSVPSALGTGQSNRNEFNSVPARIVPRDDKQYNASSPHWHWVYEGVAHGQTFRAEGGTVDALRLRVARLNQRIPTAALNVELRDEGLRTIYLTGHIHPREAGLRFRWVRVAIDYSVPLEPGKTYTLLIQSAETQHDTPWLLNATNDDPYPHGKHLGYPDDLFFSLGFDRGTALHVGPSLQSLPELPHNSGRQGGIPMPTPPSLRFPGKICPPFARRDPLGPIPEGQKVEATAEMSP